MTDSRLVLPGAAADAQAVPVDEKPKATAPISGALEVFDRLFAQALRSRQAITGGEARRYVEHAFYAGARAAFTAVVDAMQEYDGEEPGEGEKRFEAIEREIDTYFRKVIGAATIAPGGKVAP